MPVPRIPLDVLQDILQITWDDKLRTRQRIRFMRMCPLVNKEWRATYDMLASRDVYIPSMKYLHYLLRIIATGQSHVHTASHFAHRTRHVIVQTLLFGGKIPDNDAYSKIMSQLAAHSSFTGLHRCFPAATHLSFDSVDTFEFDLESSDFRSPSYVGLHVQLNDCSAVTAEWRVDLGYHIRPQVNWDELYRLQMACEVLYAVERHRCIATHYYLSGENSVFKLLKLDGDRILTLKATWDPAPFSGKWTEDLDLYASRAAAGYFAFQRFIFARWFYGDVAPSVERRARAVFESARSVFESARAVSVECAHVVFESVQAISNTARAVLIAASRIVAEAPYRWRFYDVPLGAFVNVCIVRRWPLVSAAYTGLIVCFCSRHSFLVYVSIMTVGICAITASLSLVAGLAFTALKLLVASYAVIRLVHLVTRQLLYDDHSLFNIQQDEPLSSYIWRFFDVVLVAFANAYIVHRWPLVAAAYTGLIACFQGPRQYFLVYVSIPTVGICIVYTSLLLFTELSFFVFKPFVALFVLTRLVQFTVLVASYDQNR